LRFEPYESTTGIPNVVVDGSPNASTVLTLTHWPGSRPLRRRGSYGLTCRYECWVQFCTRPIPRRVDLRPLAASLTAQDTGAAWSATAPGALTPELIVDGGETSGLRPDVVVGALIRRLRGSPPAWDPWAARAA
jgi:hypothetical protein